MAIRLLQGHALDVLQTLPSDSVQAVCTSPPYYGLRAYGTAPLVWDAAALAPYDCAHEWGREERGKRKDLLPAEDSTSTSRMGTDARQGFGPPSGGRFCQHCRAWYGSLGLEPTHLLYVQHLVAIFAEVRRVLRPDGVCWVNIADSYAGAGKSGGGYQGARWAIAGADYTGPRGGKWCPPPPGLKPKDLCLIPQRLAIALQDDGWWVRQVLPWIKRNAMPNSQQDRPTSALEWWLMLTKRARAYCNMAAVQLPRSPTTHGGNVRGPGQKYGPGTQYGPSEKNTLKHPTDWRTYRNTDLWFHSLAAPYGLVGHDETLLGLDVPTSSGPGDHYATFPPALILPLLRMATQGRPGCTVLDPFAGTCTTLLVAQRLGCDGIGIELNAADITQGAHRLREEAPLLSQVRIEAGPTAPAPRVAPQ